MSRLTVSSRRLAASWCAFALAALLTILAASLAAIRLTEARRASEWVQHTHAVLTMLEETRSAVAAAEVSRHALFRTARERAELPATHARRAGHALQASRALTRDNVLQQQRLDTLERLIADRIAELATAASLIESGRNTEAVALARSAESDHQADHIARLVGQMTTTEHTLLTARVRRQQDHAAHARVYIILTLCASSILVAVGAWQLGREMQRARPLATAADDAAREAQRAEQHARASEARFRTALDALPNGFFVARLDGDSHDAQTIRIVEVNDAGLRLVGQTRDVVLATDVDRLIGAELATGLAAVCQRVLASGVRYTGKAQLPIASAPGWLRVEIVPMSDEVAISCQDITADMRTEARLAEAATHDELTGLLNRRGFRAFAASAIRDAHRSARSDALVALDLSGFKAINDTYGHAEGDAALRTVADLLRATFGVDDAIARLGGDEFVVYVRGTGAPHEHGAVLGRIHAAFGEANRALGASGRSYRIATGIGVAVLQADDDLDALIARADVRLYEHKASDAFGALAAA